MNNFYKKGIGKEGTKEGKEENEGKRRKILSDK
jgi:hypothetical protein